MSVLLSLLFTGLSYKKGGDNEYAQHLINKDIEEARNIILRADKYLDKALNECNSALEKLYHSNKKVYDTTFKNFVGIAKNITNVSFNDKLDQVKAFEESVELPKGTLSYVDSFIAGAKGGMLLNFVAGGTFGLITQSIYSVKLSALEAEASAELAKAKASAELARYEIAKMKSIGTLAKTAKETIDNLRMIADKAIENLQEVVMRSGCDYNQYSEDEKNTTWLTFKLVSALNELTSMQIITDTGKISGKYKKFVCAANEEFIVGAIENE